MVILTTYSNQKTDIPFRGLPHISWSRRQWSMITLLPALCLPASGQPFPTLSQLLRRWLCCDFPSQCNTRQREHVLHICGIQHLVSLLQGQIYVVLFITAQSNLKEFDCDYKGQLRNCPFQ